MTIAEAIRQMAAAGLELYGKVCTVDAVDEDARTVDCTPIDEGAPLLGVNLQANQESEDGIVLFPAVGSYVVVSFLEPSVAVVVLTEEVDKMVLKIGKTTAQLVDGQIDVSVQDITAQVTADAVTFNGGKLGGLVVSGKAADKLNALEKDINELKTVFSGWTPAPQDGGAALKGAVSTWAGKSLATTAATDLENEKVKH